MTFPFNENFGEYIETEVPVSQALSDYTPRTLADEPDFTVSPKLFQITLTGEQYLRIMSSLFTGAWFVYPGNWLEVYASFWQGMTILDCDFVADCIENNENVQNSLENYLSDSGYGNGASGGSSVSPDSSALNLIPGTASCTDDNIFGMCMELVETIHQATLEVFEQINASDKYGELFSLILDNIPLLEVFGIFTEYIGWVKDSAYDSYIASWSTTIQQEIACELFCLAKEDCLLTTDMVWDTYQSLSDVPSPAENIFEQWIDEILSYVAGNDLETVASVGMVGLAAMRFGGKFSYWAAGIRDLKTTMELAANASDPDWSILCDCPTGAMLYEWDFTVNDGGWIVRPDVPLRGVYSPGVGWNSAPDSGDTQLYIINEDMAGIDIEEVQVQGIGTTGQPFTMSTKQIVMRDVYDSSSGQVLPFNSSGGDDVVCSVGLTGLPASRNTLGINYKQGNVANVWTCKKIRIRYTSGTPTGGASGWTEDCNE